MDPLYLKSSSDLHIKRLGQTDIEKDKQRVPYIELLRNKKMPQRTVKLEVVFIFRGMCEYGVLGVEGEDKCYNVWGCLLF